MDIGAGFIDTEGVCGWAGYGGVGDVVHCSFTSCLPTLCPLLPRITPRLLKICHDVGGAVVLWWCGGAVVLWWWCGGVDQRGPSSSPPPRRRLIFSVARRSAACSRGDTHGDV